MMTDDEIIEYNLISFWKSQSDTLNHTQTNLGNIRVPVFST